MMRRRPDDRLTARYVTAAVTAFLFILVLPVVPTAEAEVGSEYFNSAPGRYQSIKVADIDKDTKLEFVYGDYDGYFTVLEFSSGDFFFEWDAYVGKNRVWGLELADIDPDEEGIEIIAGNGGGELFIYNGMTHELLAMYEGLSRDAHGLFIYDFNGDKTLDIGVGTQYKNDDPNGMFYIMDYNEIKDHHEKKKDDPKHKKPEPFFMTEKDNSRWRAVDVGDPDSDGEMELVLGCGAALGDVTGEGYLRVFNFTLENHPDPLKAKAEWESEDLGGCVQGAAVVDIDNDKEPEIVISNGYRYRDGWIQMFEYDGRGGYDNYFKSENVGPKPFGFAVADVDLDGVIEVIVGNQPGYIYIMDGLTREIEWKSDLLGTDVMGLTTVDMDEDPQLEIVAAQGGYQGKGDYTSGYTTPHIYIIDGKTHKMEYTLGEKDYVQFTLQIILLVVIVVFLLEAGVLTKMVLINKAKMKAGRKAR